MSPQHPVLSTEGRRIVICDYNALLLSVTGLLRMSGYQVFQAYDGPAVLELCHQLPNIELLILNTYGAGIDTGDLIRKVRATHHDLAVLHIGTCEPDGLPSDVPTLFEGFSSEELLAIVGRLINPMIAIESRPWLVRNQD